MDEKPLSKMHKTSILATDISGQFWCERQMELNHLHGQKYTQAMKQGTAIHKTLQEEVYIALEAKPEGYADFLYKTAYENYASLRSLKTKGVGREIKFYGSINGYKLVGKVDELKLADGKVVIVENKTKSFNKNLEGGLNKLEEVSIRPHKIQIMLYRRMLEDLKEKRYAFENFTNSYRLKDMKLSSGFVEAIQKLGISMELANLEYIHKKMFEEFYTLPDISNMLEIHYIDRYTNEEGAMLTINYDFNEFQKDLSYAIKYWNGERESAPVAEIEKWKCNACKFFGKECVVWWNK